MPSSPNASHDSASHHDSTRPKPGTDTVVTVNRTSDLVEFRVQVFIAESVATAHTW